jgi:hypothetical protein
VTSSLACLPATASCMRACTACLSLPLCRCTQPTHTWSIMFRNAGHCGTQRRRVQLCRCYGAWRMARWCGRHCQNAYACCVLAARGAYDCFFLRPRALMCVFVCVCVLCCDVSGCVTACMCAYRYVCLFVSVCVSVFVKMHVCMYTSHSCMRCLLRSLTKAHVDTRIRVFVCRS